MTAPPRAWSQAPRQHVPGTDGRRSDTHVRRTCAVGKAGRMLRQECVDRLESAEHGGEQGGAAAWRRTEAQAEESLGAGSGERSEHPRQHPDTTGGKEGPRGRDVCPREHTYSDVRRRNCCCGSNPVTSGGRFRNGKLRTRWPSTKDTVGQSQRRGPSAEKEKAGGIAARRARVPSCSDTACVRAPHPAKPASSSVKQR